MISARAGIEAKYVDPAQSDSRMILGKLFRNIRNHQSKIRARKIKVGKEAESIGPVQIASCVDFL